MKIKVTAQVANDVLVKEIANTRSEISLFVDQAERLGSLADKRWVESSMASLGRKLDKLLDERRGLNFFSSKDALISMNAARVVRALHSPATDGFDAVVEFMKRME